MVHVLLKPAKCIYIFFAYLYAFGKFMRKFVRRTQEKLNFIILLASPGKIPFETFYMVPKPLKWRITDSVSTKNPYIFPFSL